MMWTIFSWLAGSRAGRWTASILLLCATLTIVAARFYLKGKQAAGLQQTEEALKRLKERIKVDETIRHMPADERRRRLQDHWGK